MINLSIRARLLLLVAFPVVLLLIYIGIDLRDARTRTATGSLPSA